MKLLIAIIIIGYMFYLISKDVTKKEVSYLDLGFSFLIMLYITNFNIIFITCTAIVFILEIFNMNFLKVGFIDFIFLQTLFYLFAYNLIKGFSINMNYFLICIFLNFAIYFIQFAFKSTYIRIYKKEINSIPFLLFVLPVIICNFIFSLFI